MGVVWIYDRDLRLICPILFLRMNQGKFYYYPLAELS